MGPTSDAESDPMSEAESDRTTGIDVDSGAEPGTWRWPTGGVRIVLRTFTAPATRYAAGHRGIDIAVDGSVLAPADGIVHFAGIVIDRPVLSIMHSGGYLSSYEPVTTSLHRGDTVHRGQVIGEVVPSSLPTDSDTVFPADGGHQCVSDCLHFGVRVNGEYISPLVLVGDIPRSVLLPTRRIAPYAHDTRAATPDAMVTTVRGRRHRMLRAPPNKGLAVTRGDAPCGSSP